MIKLRLIGPSADLKHLVYSSKKTGKKGSHLVNVDEDLFDVLEDVVRRRRRGDREAREEAQARRTPAPRVESKIPPRDVQRLLRAGRTPEQVAKSAQVPIAWVEQFLTPVLYERQGMVREAQRAWLEKQRLGASGSPLGDSVAANLRSRHVRLSDAEFADAWDAHRAEGQPWTVTMKFRFRGREARAIWKYDPVRRTVTAGNRLAADLGWVAPGRRIVARVTPSGSPAKRAAAKKRAPAKKRTATKKKTATRKRPAAKKKTATRRRPAAKKKTAARKRTTARRARRR